MLVWMVGIVALSLGAAGPALAQPVPLYAAAGVKAPSLEIIQGFQSEGGRSVVAVFDTAGAAEAQFIANGKRGLLITTQVRIQQSKQLTGGVTGRVGDTLAGVAVSSAARASLPASIETPEQLKAALQAAKRIAYSDPARGATVGVHFMQVIDKLGVRDEVLAKGIKARDGVETMKLIMAGEADLGITQLSEIVQADKTTLLGAFPVALELATRYDFWYAADLPNLPNLPNGEKPDPAAEALAKAFTSEAGKARLRYHGLRVP